MDLIKETLEEAISQTDSEVSLKDIEILYKLFEKSYYQGIDTSQDMKDAIDKIS